MAKRAGGDKGAAAGQPVKRRVVNKGPSVAAPVVEQRPTLKWLQDNARVLSAHDGLAYISLIA